MLPNHPGRPERRWLLGVSAVGVMLAVCWVVLQPSTSDPAPEGLIVVTADPGSPEMISRPRQNPVPQELRGAASTEAVLAKAKVAYPLLTYAQMNCTAGRCVLTARILPMQAQADLNKRQQMLLGGLAEVLAEDGYQLIPPVKLDEVADMEFLLHADILPPGTDNRGTILR